MQVPVRWVSSRAAAVVSSRRSGPGRSASPTAGAVWPARPAPARSAPGPLRQIPMREDLIGTSSSSPCAAVPNSEGRLIPRNHDSRLKRTISRARTQHARYSSEPRALDAPHSTQVRPLLRVRQKDPLAAANVVGSPTCTGPEHVRRPPTIRCSNATGGRALFCTRFIPVQRAAVWRPTVRR